MGNNSWSKRHRVGESKSATFVPSPDTPERAASWNVSAVEKQATNTTIARNAKIATSMDTGRITALSSCPCLPQSIKRRRKLRKTMRKAKIRFRNKPLMFPMLIQRAIN